MKKHEKIHIGGGLVVYVDMHMIVRCQAKVRVSDDSLVRNNKEAQLCEHCSWRGTKCYYE